jgi:hypothetical protein
MLFDLRKDLEFGADMVNQIELIRGQLDHLRPALEDSLKIAADGLEQEID